MKQDLYPELKKIEDEIKEIKILIMASQKFPKKVAKLEGALKGIKVSEKDVEEAKKSVFKRIQDWE